MHRLYMYRCCWCEVRTSMSRAGPLQGCPALMQSMWGMWASLQGCKWLDMYPYLACRPLVQAVRIDDLLLQLYHRKSYDAGLLEYTTAAV